MATDISIVIRGQDDFSPAFERLDAAFAAVSASGARAARGMADMEAGLQSVSAQAGATAEAAGAAAESLGERLREVPEAVRVTMEQAADQQAEAAAVLHERLLAVDAAGQERRLTQQGGAHGRERSQWGSHHGRLLADRAALHESLAALDQAALRTQSDAFAKMFEGLAALARTGGRRTFGAWQAFARANAIISTAAAVANALAVPPPWVGAALAVAAAAKGAAQLAIINSTRLPAAHGGLEFVPREQTFLLDRGERVLSPNQNQDLTRFLAVAAPAPAPAGDVRVEHLTIHVLENATSGGALLQMEPEAMRQVVAEKLIPTLDELARLGIRPDFLRSNT